MPKPTQKSGAKKNNLMLKIISPPPHPNLYKRFPPGRCQQPLPVGMSSLQWLFPKFSSRGKKEKSIGPAPQTIIVREPLPAATTNSSAPVTALRSVR
ncbi:hypothetical protein CDAR_62691 [Caerostris darwini]|uniref:Uncharacterized protein n=1 Tax=Caerostris darwini TaxID=1538125 RepID=A0AAV4UF86_9ARAC|nr:hypothetical protein CDAR_62691 [Caerostris darwini]